MGWSLAIAALSAPPTPLHHHPRLQIQDRSILRANILDQGNGGDITVTAGDRSLSQKNRSLSKYLSQKKRSLSHSTNQLLPNIHLIKKRSPSHQRKAIALNIYIEKSDRPSH